MKTLVYNHAETEECFGIPEEPVSYIFTDSFGEATGAVNELVTLASYNYPGGRWGMVDMYDFQGIITLEKLMADSKSDFLKRLVKRAADLVDIEEKKYNECWFNAVDILYKTKIMSKHNNSCFTEVKPIYYLQLPPINNSFSRGKGLAPLFTNIPDDYDFSSKKQSLKKFEMELGIRHQEMDMPWDKR